jgi:hypothetical protein
MAFGEHKAPVIRKAVEGEITSTIAASFLQEHPGAKFVLDGAAAAELTRFRAPWLLGHGSGHGGADSIGTTERWSRRPSSGSPRDRASRSSSSPTRTTTRTGCRAC